jgi:hypothetical protein
MVDSKRVVFVLIVCILAYQWTFAEEQVLRLRGIDRITYEVPTGLDEYEAQGGAMILLANGNKSTMVILSMGPKAKKIKTEQLFKQIETSMSATMSLRQAETIPERKLPYTIKGKPSDPCMASIKKYTVRNSNLKVLVALIKSRKYYYVLSVKSTSDEGIKQGLVFLESLKLEKDRLFG